MCRLYLLPILLLMAFSCKSSKALPPKAGLENQRLKNCPDSPNCICTMDVQHPAPLAALPFKGDMAETIAHIKKTAAAMEGSALQKEENNYLHFTYTTHTMKFIDDVEFLLDPAMRVVHFRSASRVGYYDLGTNKRRMKAFSTSYNAQK